MATTGQADRCLSARTAECQVACRPVSLRMNVSWTFLGNTVYSACQWGIIVVLAKLGDVEMVGRLSLALAVTAPVVIFSQLQLRAVQVTDAKRCFAFRDYLRLRLVTTLLAVLAIGGIAAASALPPQTTVVVMIIAGAKALDAVSDVYFGAWQRAERMDAVAKAQGTSGLVALAALAALVVWTHDLVWAVCGIACGSAAGLGFVVLRQGRIAGDARPTAGPSPSANARRLWQLAGLSLPLAFAGGIASLQVNLPRYCLSDLHGARALAMYCVAYTPLAAVTLVCQAISAAITPRAALYYQAGRLPAYRRLALQVTAAQVLVCLASCGVLFLFGRPLFALVFTKEYAAAVPASVVMSAGLAILNLGTWGTSLLSAGRMFHAQLLLVSLTFVLQVPVTWWLASRYGVWGAAWSDFARCVVVMVLVNAYAAHALGKLRSGQE